MKILLTFVWLASVWSQNLTEVYVKEKTKSDDFLNQDPVLNEKYSRGPHLIYDCEGYWGCVAQIKSCLSAETYQDYPEGKEQNVKRCIHFQSFNSYNECTVKQKAMVGKGLGASELCFSLKKF